jgi:hypothetical protein
MNAASVSKNHPCVYLEIRRAVGFNFRPLTREQLYITDFITKILTNPPFAFTLVICPLNADANLRD